MSLSTTMETGETVSMEIYPANSKDLADLVRGVINELELIVDKSPAVPITVETREDYVNQFEILRTEKIRQGVIEQKLKPFTNLAFRVHRFLTGKTNEYLGYGSSRISVLDRALVAFNDRQQAKDRELEENMRKQTEREDEERRKEEARVLTERGETARAKQILEEKPREFAISVTSSTPSIKGGGIKKRWIATCVDEDKLLLAVARPIIYREVAARMKAEGFGKNASSKQMIALVASWASECPTIPTSIFCSTKTAKDALDTKLTANANATNGKIDWPGVAVEEDKKAQVRR
jgi:hypothetical protein